MGAADDLGAQFDTAMAEVIAFAGGCTPDDWQAVCPGEERTVGVLFDHIAAGNDEAVVWIEAFLAGQPVSISPERLQKENAEHAHRAAGRPRPDTIADLRQSAARTSHFLTSLTDEQLQVQQEFGWAGMKDVAFIGSTTVRHPQRHLKSIREALGR